MTSSAGTARVGLALAFSGAVLFGVGGAVAAGTFGALSPPQLAEGRAVLAAAFFLPYAWWRGRLHVARMRGHLVVFGLVLAFVNVAYYWAIQRLGVGPGVTIQFLAPSLVLVWMALVQRRRVPAVAWPAAAVTIVGVALVTDAWRVEHADWVGVAAGLAAAVAFAAYLLIGERLGEALPAVTVMAWSFLVAAFAWLVLLPPWTFPWGVTGGVWVRLLWIGLAGTALPFLVEMAALQRASAGLVGVVATSEPVVAALAGWWLLGQTLGVSRLLGMALVVAAVAALQRRGVTEMEVPYEVVR